MYRDRKASIGRVDFFECVPQRHCEDDESELPEIVIPARSKTRYLGGKWNSIARDR